MTAGDDRSGSNLGYYRLIELIGRGGMGQVYRARDTRRDRDVALKLLNPALADQSDFRERFMRESQTAARLNDPHVIPIHDWGEIDGLLFIDMRLVEGRNLRDLVNAEGPLPESRALHILRQVGDALDAAHDAGLIHRDVKPDNIIVDHRDFAYLVDFGLAQGLTDPRMTTVGAAIGSLAYMAPERFGPDPAGPVSDIYSLTCVLYEMLSGRPAFQAPSIEQMIASQLRGAAPRLNSPLDPVVQRGMSKVADHRYARARDLLDAAQAAISGAAPPGESRRQAQWATTHVAIPAPSTDVPMLVDDRAARSGIARPVIGAVVAAVLAVAAVGWWLVAGRSVPKETDSTSQQAITTVTTVTSTDPTSIRTTVTSEQPAPSQPRFSTGDLGLGTPISRPACDGTGIVVVGNATEPATYQTEIAALLSRYPGSSYLRTDQTCPSLRQSLDGNPIYAAYYVAGKTTGEICALRGQIGGNAYGKWLDMSSPPDHQISCG
ncbi:serine/threonine-protein kinase [Gordonia sp. CPCC 205515]|uniref:serine/threonine-protein kinase n=1 Tax=Gordonia sp. CPCC 205515 TaxID=3140791 RepID=UPI003AF401F3